ncbi:protein Shroom1-like isoform X3 [Centruroides vittatus]|uniref:protein Shroom1-like isoform X3 n=1 Tax=Centruroides vittatus TaxID=120091 RepID=UPI00350FEEC9
MPAPGRPKMVYHFIRPGGSIKQELLARQRSNTSNTEVIKKEATSGNILWQKASALRQSLRSSKKTRQDAPHHVRSYSDYGDGRLTDANRSLMYYPDHVPLQDLRRNQKSQRKLTRDSGYETSSGQTEPDYVNSDWLSNHVTNNYYPLEKKHHRKENRYVSRSQSYGRDSYKIRPCNVRSPFPDFPYHPFSHYSSTESLTSCWSNCTTLEEDQFVYPARSVPDLDQVGDMVTRKFKKGSVYETLATKSGLDFAPVIQGRPYWERREQHTEEFAHNRKLINNKCDVNIRHETEKITKKVSPGIHCKYKKDEEKQISPPPPPVRNSSSLKYIRHQPQTHEKYPSWPAVPTSESDSSNSALSSSKSSPAATSHRSNSWTEQTNYPKERIAYCRPKKCYKISPNQLQPVLERSVLENGNRQQKHEVGNLENSLKEALHSDPIDLDSLCRSYYPRQTLTVSRDYNIHSPPERDVPRPTIHDRTRKHPENNQSCYWNNGPDSCTPLLDRLRLESEVMPSNWSPQVELETPSETGNESVDGSNSSQETLKWHGSCSDLSCSNKSSIFDSGRSTLPDRLSPQSCDSSTSQIVHSSRVEPAQRHDSESVLYYLSPARSNKNDDRKNFSTSFPGFSRNGCDSNYYSTPDNISKLKVSERSCDINRLKHENECETKHQKYQYLDPEKRHRISDPELKAIQKQAVLSFYHRQTAAQTNTSNGGDMPVPHESPPISPGRMKWNQWGDNKLDKVPEHAVLATDPLSRTTIRGNKTLEEFRNLENQLSLSVPNLNEVALPHHQISSQQTTGIRSQSFMDEPVNAHNVQESKDRPPDSSSAASHQQQQSPSYKQPRKVQLKEVHHCNDKSVFQVITTDGVTIAESLKNSLTVQKLGNGEYPTIPPKRINKPVPQPPRPVSSRRPPPPVPSDHEEDDAELLRIEESSKQSDGPPSLANTKPEKTTPVDSSLPSNCSSPDLPLPPPPSTTETEVHHSDEPLPPPPEFEVKTSSANTPTMRNRNRPSVKNFLETACPNSIPSPLERSQAVNAQVSSQRNSNFSEGTKHKNEEESRIHPTAAEERESESVTIETQINSSAGSGLDHSRLSGFDNTECDSNLQSSSSVTNVGEDSFTTQKMEDTSENSKTEETTDRVRVEVCLTNSATQTSETPRLARKITKSREELECERLSRDFVECCGDSLLKSLLVPASDQKTMLDYMAGLLDLETENNGETALRNHPRRQLQLGRASDKCQPKPAINGWWESSGIPLDSPYFSVIEPKAKLLTRYCREVTKYEWINEAELNKKKDELIASIGRKLEMLRMEQLAIKDEVAQNEELGREVTSKVEQLAKPNEAEKFRLHVEELEKIINLLLSLSGRLARVQNALMNLPKEASKEERMLLEAKRNKLSEQHEEARHLKESIDRRSQQVSTFLHKYLRDDEYSYYDHFVKRKSRLLIDVREIDEKIKLGEEQLAALRNNADSHLWTQLQSNLDLSTSQVQLCRT